MLKEKTRDPVLSLSSCRHSIDKVHPFRCESFIGFLPQVGHENIASNLPCLSTEIAPLLRREIFGDAVDHASQSAPVNL